MKRLAYLGIGAVVGSLLVVVWGSTFVQDARSQERHHVEGAVVIQHYGATTLGGTCGFSHGIGIRDVNGEFLDLSDLEAVPQVVIRDEAGTIIAKTQFQPMGVTVRLVADDEEQVGSGNGSGCALPFVIDDLPDRPFYSVQVGLRPSRVFTKAEFAINDWHPFIEIRY